MSEDRCIHDMLPGQCADCTGRDGGERAERQRRARLLLQSDVYAAKWGTTCVCGERIQPGDPIKFRPRAYGERGGGWIGPCCIGGF